MVGNHVVDIVVGDVVVGDVENIVSIVDVGVGGIVDNN